MSPTRYPPIDDLLATLLAGSRRILGDNFVGLYLFGSLASGGFDDERSDIDFVVVTKTDLPASAQAQLGTLNAHLQATCPRWARKLEGSFLPLHVLEDFNPAGTTYPTIGMGGWYGLDHKGIEQPIQRCLLREDGITLAGPEPKSFIATVTPDELRTASRAVLHGWWQAQLEDPVRIRRRGYQAYAVLTMCRVRYTLETGRVASKAFAAGWARNRLDAQWHGLIGRGLAWTDGDGVDDLDATLALIRCTIERTRDAR